MTDKEKYIRFCEQESLIPIYMRNWWLDCNCGPDKWNVLLYGKDGEIEAFMTYFQPYPGVVSMPMYSQSMGIWFNPAYDLEDTTKNIGRRHEICDFFIDHLPAHNHYLQRFPPSFTDWLPFYWKGYKQTTRYDYILPDISDVDKLWSELPEIRRSVNRAKNRYGLSVKRGIALDDFFAIYDKTYKRQGIATPEAGTLRKIIEESQRRGLGDVWGAYDADNRLHAVLFVAWQESHAYAIASGRDPELPNSLAPTLLFWESICFASTVSRSFDCEGSMLQGVEWFLRKFGGVQTPYFTLYKGKRGLKDFFRIATSKIRRMIR